MKTCTSACMAKFIIQGCKCWPPDILYTQNTQLDANKTMKWCNWRYGLEGLSSFKMFELIFTKCFFRKNGSFYSM